MGRAPYSQHAERVRPGDGLAGAHEEAPVLAGPGEQLLGLGAGDVAMVPAGDHGGCGSPRAGPAPSPQDLHSQGELGPCTATRRRSPLGRPGCCHPLTDRLPVSGTRQGKGNELQRTSSLQRPSERGPPPSQRARPPPACCPFPLTPPHPRALSLSFNGSQSPEGRASAHVLLGELSAPLGSGGSRPASEGARPSQRPF